MAAMKTGVIVTLGVLGLAGLVLFISQANTLSLNHTQWTILKVGDKAVAKSGSQTPSLAFKSDRFSGTGGCNRLVGRFEQHGEHIVFDQRIASTMMACPTGMDVDAQLGALLPRVRRLKIADDHLYFYTEDNQILFILERTMK